MVDRRRSVWPIHPHTTGIRSNGRFSKASPLTIPPRPHCTGRGIHSKRERSYPNTATPQTGAWNIKSSSFPSSRSFFTTLQFCKDRERSRTAGRAMIVTSFNKRTKNQRKEYETPHSMSKTVSTSHLHLHRRNPLRGRRNLWLDHPRQGLVAQSLHQSHRR